MKLTTINIESVIQSEVRKKKQTSYINARMSLLIFLLGALRGQINQSVLSKDLIKSKLLLEN